MLQEFVIARDMQNIHKNIEVAFLYLLQQKDVAINKSKYNAK